MKVKNLIGQIHLWVGLTIGLFFFVIAFSGALYTWAPEMSRILYKEGVEPLDAPFVTVSTLKATLDRDFPEGDFRAALYRDRASTIEVLLYAPGTYYKAFLNPYTGSLIHLQDMNKGVVNYLKFLHRNLMLGPIGRQLVHWVTFFSCLMLIMGLVLWWPVRKSGIKQRFMLRWTASPKRLNYDLHNVLGFYATWISIFAILTGIYWGFGGLKDVLRGITGEDNISYVTPTSDNAGMDETRDQFVLMDSLIRTFREQHPAKFIRISNPHKPTDPIHVVVRYPDLPAYLEDHYYFDRYTGNQISGNFEHGLHTETSRFQLINKMIYDIHFGSILGLPGRFLTFLASLIVASLPVTGFIIWWRRRKKSA